nr:hypothetical protein [Tanacetum cinerariifolium]
MAQENYGEGCSMQRPSLLEPNGRAKVTAIEEAKDLATLPLEELIENLKVYEMVLDNDGVASKTTKEKVNSLALKAKVTRKQTSDNSTCQDESDEDEEINLMAKNFRKFSQKGVKVHDKFEISQRNLFLPLDNPELTIRKRSRSDPTLLNNYEMNAEGHGDLPVPDLRTMEELCQPSLNGRGGPIAPIAIQATNFGLKNDMIQQVQNTCQFHGLPSDDANKHLDKFLHVTQSIKVNGVTDDALRLNLFPHSLTHHATAWFDRLPRNSINTFEQMAKMFLGKYFPPSMVTKLRNEITNFRQRPDESLFEAWERGTFMKRRPEECYDFIKNMTAHHNDWDTSAQRSESSSSITSSDTKIAALKAEMAEINKNLMRVLQVNQQVKAVTPNCETCGGPHSFFDCPATIGNIQNVYAAGAYQATVGQTHNVYAVGAYQGCNSYQPQGNCNLLSYRSDNYLRPPGFNPNQNQNNQNQNFQNQNRNQGKNHAIPQGNNQGRNQFFQGASHGQNAPPAYQAPAYQAPGYQGPVHQPSTPQPQVVTTTEFTNYMKANDAILKNMQTNMILLTNSNLELKNMFGQFMKMNTTSSSGSGTLPSNTITNPKEDLKGITTRSGTAYQGPTIPTTSSSLPQVVKRDTEVTKDTVPPTNNESTKKVQPSVVQIETPIPNSDPVVAPTRKDLVDVYEGQLTLHVGKEAITFNLDQTSRYSANYNDMAENRIDVIDMSCEEYSQDVLSFFDVIASGNPTPYYDTIVSTSSLTLTPFRDSDFLLKEVDAFLALENDPTSPKVDQSFYDTEGDILLLEAFLNDDPSLPLPLKEYLSVEEKAALIKVLKSHKQAIISKLSDIKGINLEFCTHKILMEDDFEPTVQHQRRVNPKIHEVIKKEVLKLLDAELIYLISNSPWKIARSMTRLLEKETPFFFSNKYVEAFQTLKKKLTEAPILVAPDWDLPFELMCDGSDFAIVWNKLSLPELSPTYMTLELADRLISRPVGVAEDVFVKVGTFH